MAIVITKTKSKRSLPSTQRADAGLSILGILKQTPPYVKAKARDYVVVKRYNPQALTKGKYPAVTATCVSMEHKSPTPHKLSVIGMDKTQPLLSKQKRVMVSCDCGFFCFYCEYALWTWGAAKIKYSNGDPAVMTNPGNLALCCKHLAKVLKMIRERGE